MCYYLFLNLEVIFSWPSWTSKYVISSWNTLYLKKQQIPKKQQISKNYRFQETDFKKQHISKNKRFQKQQISTSYFQTQQICSFLRSVVFWNLLFFSFVVVFEMCCFLKCDIFEICCFSNLSFLVICFCLVPP